MARTLPGYWRAAGSVLGRRAINDLYNAFTKKGPSRYRQSYKSPSPSPPPPRSTRRATRNVVSSQRRTRGFEPQPADNWTIEDLPQQTLSQYQLRFPPARFNAEDLDYSYENGLRSGPRVHCKGVRLWMEVTNKSSLDVEVHFAFIQKRSPTQGFAPNEFFTNHRIGESKTKGFADGNAQGYADYQRYMKINSDRYVVLDHKILDLGPQNTTSTQVGEVANSPTDLTGTQTISKKQANNRINHDKYYKVNQVFQFDRPQNSAPDKELIFLMWYTARNIEDFGKLGTNANIKMNSRYQLYYADMD